jgi:hypothetical protein
MIDTKNMKDTLEGILEQRTLIIGDINSGKTRLTALMIETCCTTGLGSQITVLDLSPEPVQGIGGKLPLPPGLDILLLSCPIIAPRLTGIDAEDIQSMAEQNARHIEPLIGAALKARRSILAVNDATLYLQTGRLERILDLMAAHPTVIINAYHGHSLPPAPFTQREHDLVEELIQHCDRLIRFP